MYSYSIPDMYTAIPHTKYYSGSDCKYRTRTARHQSAWTRPLTCPPSVIKTSTLLWESYCTDSTRWVARLHSGCFPAQKTSLCRAPIWSIFRPRYFILLRVVALAWALVRGVRLVQRPLVGTGILTVPPATSWVCSCTKYKRSSRFIYIIYIRLCIIKQ